jgi:hypothetical protein
MTGAHQVRIVTITEEEIVLRAREGLLFAFPKMPGFVRRLVRVGSLDWALAGTRQAIRDIEKPVDLLTHEGRAAWVLATHRGLMSGLDQAGREAVAQIAVTAIRVGNKDFVAPTHAVIRSGSCGPMLLALIGLALGIVALARVF